MGSPPENTTVAYLTLLFCFDNLCLSNTNINTMLWLLTSVDCFIFQLIICTGSSFQTLERFNGVCCIAVQFIATDDALHTPKRRNQKFQKKIQGRAQFRLQLPSNFGDSCNTKISYLLQVNRCFLRYQVLTGRIENEMN